MGFIKVELSIKEKYLSGSHIEHTSLNAAYARIPIYVGGVGEAILYNPNFYQATSKWWYVLGGAVVFGLVYGLYALYGKWRRKRINKVKAKVD